MRRAVAALAATVVGAALVPAATGCGRSDPDQPSRLVQDQLRPHTRQVRSAALARDRPGAELALSRFRTSVNDLHVQGHLNKDQAERFLALAARVEANLALLPRPAPPSTQPSTQRPPTPVPPEDREEDRGEDGGKNGNKGKGREGD